MTEVKWSGTNRLLAFLVVFLIAAAAVQGYFLLKIYRNGKDTEQTSAPGRIQLVPTAHAAPAAPRQFGNQSAAGGPHQHGAFGIDPDDSPWNWAPDDWDPFSELQRMQERMNRLFDDSFGRFQVSPGGGSDWAELSFAPRLDLKEESDRYIVRLDVPGAEKSNISVNVEDRQLTVTGQIDETVEQKDGAQILRKERRSGRFQRSIALPGTVDADAMTAEYDAGVLTVTVPKGKPAAQSRTITIL